MLFEHDTIPRIPRIFLCEYSRMILLLFLIVLVIYMLPAYPHPKVVHNFLAPEEREYIMKKANNNLEPSTVSIDKVLDEKIRRSETAWLDYDDPVVRRVMERCLQYIDRPLDNCEKLQVLRYTPGGFYRPHQDVGKMMTNPRLYTFILALNDGYDGGETEFQNLDKSFRLKAGDMLFFETLDNYELMTSKALHGGKPVKNGEKWICNLWVHKHPY